MTKSSFFGIFNLVLETVAFNIKLLKSEISMNFFHHEIGIRLNNPFGTHAEIYADRGQKHFQTDILILNTHSLKLKLANNPKLLLH